MVKLHTRQSLHTTTQLLQGSSEVRAKIWSNYIQEKAYILQHSYSKAYVKLEPKFGQITHKRSLHTTTQLIQGLCEVRAKIWSNYTQDKAYILQHSYSKAYVKLSQNLVKLYTRDSLHTTTQLLQGFCEVRAKIWSNYTQEKAYILQHSFSKAPVKLEPKFGQIIHKRKPTYYNTATPRLTCM